MQKIVQTLGLALLGGLTGGALVGYGEAAAIVTTMGSAEEYWLIPFAFIAYGMLGVAAGLGAAVLVVLVDTVVGRRLNPFGLAAACAVFPLGFAVARYRVVQQVFHEGLTLFSADGILVHGGIVLGLVIVAALLWFVGRVLENSGCGIVYAAGALGAAFAIGAAVAAAASSGSSERIDRSTSGAASGKPNLILIIADTLRADAVDWGNPGESALAALAQDGVRFESAYAQSTWTRPSVATILTSLYPSRHGAVHKMDPLPGHVTTLAEAARSAGYWTAGFVSNINVAPIFNFQQGFDEYTYLEPDFYFGATDSCTRLAIYKGLRVAREKLFRERIYFNHYYQDAEIVDTAVSKWLDQEPPAPFFLLIHYMDPHDPFFEIPYNGRGVARVSNQNPAAENSAEYRRLYDQGVRYMDAFLQRLFDRLKQRGLYDNTVIVFTADHGEEFQEHGGWWHGTTLYEEQMKVPLLIKRTGGEGAGKVDSRLVRTLDIAPTMMAAAGLPVDREFMGRDLFDGEVWENKIFAEEDLEGNFLTVLRIDNWKLIQANPDNPRGLAPIELYDLDRDPFETQNLAEQESAKVREMVELLEQEIDHIQWGD